MDRHEMRSLISNTSVVITAEDLDKLTWSEVNWPKGEPGVTLPVRDFKPCKGPASVMGRIIPNTLPEPLTIGEARAMASTTPGGFLEVDGDGMTATLWAEADGVAWPVQTLSLL